LISNSSARLRRSRPCEVIYQETRTFDSGKGSTSVLRLKEDANDYRYFTEPDLAPVRLTPAWIEGQRSSLPELPRARKARYQDQLGLSEYDAQLLTEDKATAAFFDALCAAGAPPKTAANWITGPVAGWLNEARQQHRPPACFCRELGRVDWTHRSPYR